MTTCHVVVRIDALSTTMNLHVLSCQLSVGKIAPAASVASPAVVKFSPNLSGDEFMSYLRKEGLSAKDCEIMKGKDDSYYRMES